MKRLRRRAIVLVVVLSAARLTVYAIGRPSAGVANRAYVLALGAVAAWILLSLTRRVTTAPHVTGFHDACRVTRDVHERPARLTALEDLAAFGADKAQGRHFHLRPHVRELTAQALAGRGIDLDSDPQAATLLGPQTWALVRPDVDRPADPRAPGLTPAEVQAITTTLEQLR